MVEAKKIDFVFNTADIEDVRQEENDGYLLRRKSVDTGTPLITNIKIAKMFVESLANLGSVDAIHTYSYDHFMDKHRF
jgi:hypothetical protein